MIETETAMLDSTQLAAYEKLVSAGGGLLFMHVGDGKTRPALKAAHDICTDRGGYVILVVCRRAAFYDWEKEVATLQLGYKVMDLEECKLNQMFSKPTLLLVSEGIISNPGIHDLITTLSPQIGCMILDEGWLYKNPKTEKHKVANDLSFHQDLPTILLSGSVMTARNLVDIYGQVKAAGRQLSLARTLTDFRSKYQNGIQGNFFAWYPKPGAYKAIMEAIEPFTFVHMPDIRSIKEQRRIIKVKPTDEQLALIKELKETAALEGHFELSQMANIITKAQQISNGWIKSDTGRITHVESNKIHRLLADVDDLLETTDYKLVIWCAFREDIKRLIPYMAERAKVATLQSGAPFDRDLWNYSKTRICLATEASGSSVNHFAQVPYGLYFSQDCKWHSLRQSMGRHTRRSSDHDIAYFLFYHTEKSLDSQVYYTVKTSQSSEHSFIKQMDILQWLKTK